MNDDETKYLDPDEAPFDGSDEEPDPALDPEKSELLDPTPDFLDPDEAPLDDSTDCLIKSLKDAFGAPQEFPFNVNVEGTQLRIVESGVEVVLEGSWRPYSEIGAKKDVEIRRALGRLREKGRG